MTDHFENRIVINDDQMDDLDLTDVLAFIQKNYRVFIGGALLGAVLGLGASFVVPSEYQASALIRLGSVGNGEAVEPPAQLIERLSSNIFRKNILSKLQLETTDEKIENFKKKLEIKLEKSGLISIAVKANSTDIAKMRLNLIINEFKKEHDKLSKLISHRFKQELATTEASIKQINTQSERLRKSLETGKLENEKTFSAAVIESSVLLKYEEELLHFRNRKVTLEDILSPNHTYATEVLGGVDVSSSPVYPKKSAFAMAGLFMGLLFGGVFSLYKVRKN